MKPSQSNPFLNQGDAPESRPSTRSLAGLLAPMRAMLTNADWGFALALEPARAVDILEPWSTLGSDPAANTLLLGSGGRMTDSLEALAARLGLDVEQRFDADALIVDRRGLALLAASSTLDAVTAVRIDGPIEAGDVKAIRLAIANGQSPLAAEVRAVAALSFLLSRAVHVDTRSRYQAARFVAESFRQYLAAVRLKPSGQVNGPEVPLIENLLDWTGRIAVRPIETEVYSTSIDVGVSTDTSGEVVPANTSLIYDLHSATWHGE